MAERRSPAKIDYGKPLDWRESVLVAAPAFVLLWALAEGYGPLLFIWAVGILLAGTALRLAFDLWRLWRL
jgi:hypothetical protein